MQFNGRLLLRVAIVVAALGASPAHAREKGHEGFFKPVYGYKDYVECGTTNPNVEAVLDLSQNKIAIDDRGVLALYGVSIVDHAIERPANLGPAHRLAPIKLIGMLCKFRRDLKVASDCHPDKLKGSCRACSQSECREVSWDIEQLRQESYNIKRRAYRR